MGGPSRLAELSWSPSGLKGSLDPPAAVHSSAPSQLQPATERKMEGRKPPSCTARRISRRTLMQTWWSCQKTQRVLLKTIKWPEVLKGIDRLRNERTQRTKWKKATGMERYRWLISKLQSVRSWEEQSTWEEGPDKEPLLSTYLVKDWPGKEERKEKIAPKVNKYLGSTWGRPTLMRRSTSTRRHRPSRRATNSWRWCRSRERPR